MPDGRTDHALLDGYRFIDLVAAERRLGRLSDLPISLRIIVENMLRQEGRSCSAEDIEAVVAEGRRGEGGREIAFCPSRVIMQDYAGIPALIDLASLRDRVAASGGDPDSVNPQVPSDLVVDHSLVVHAAGTLLAAAENLATEYADNRERYAFLKWAQQAFSNLRIVLPGQGIVHQVNIEHLAEIVGVRSEGPGPSWLVPDTLVGTDSHTTMVNGLGVLGWGVGGIEAEAVMLGEPLSMVLPPVIGVHLRGEMQEGILATDVALTLTEALRRKGVVGAMLEFFGPGVGKLSVPDRTTIANMAPEFGATTALFPTDERTLDYLAMTGRPRAHIALVERYLRRNRLWPETGDAPRFADVVDFDLGGTHRSVAGPRRPQELRGLSEVPAVVRSLVGADDVVPGQKSVRDGDIVIAAITSCTNTSNPSAMIAAGLLARNARRRGLGVHPRIKTSLAPGSRVVRDYLETAGLLPDLEALGFAVVGFACTTCVGNSGALDPDIERAILDDDLCVAAVLSGNRNFEARIHASVRANFLASPPLVVAYALAGSVLTDVTKEPLGVDGHGKPVMLSEIWPKTEEIAAVVAATVTQGQFRRSYADLFEGDASWKSLVSASGPLFAWSPSSSYFRRPPFFDLSPLFGGGPLLDKARPLLVLGDSVTTDHISPVGAIAAESPAGQYLTGLGVSRGDFNAYGARRGNHEVMTRGTFAHPRLANVLSDKPGGHTLVMPERQGATIFEASLRYAERDQQTLIVAGAMYGAGSARDWAAKGTRLLGVRAVLAKSFERIHRSNLVRMGVVCLEFVDPDDHALFSATEDALLTIDAPLAALAPSALLVALLSSEASQHRFTVRLRADTAEELHYLRAGGILPGVLAKFLPSNPDTERHG